MKGRSSSPAINSLLKRSLPVYLGADLHEGLTFFNSEDNPADDGRETRGPVQALPAWFGPLACGDTAPLDCWLSDQGELDEDGSSGPSARSIRDRLATAEPPCVGISETMPAPAPIRAAPSRSGLASGRARRARRNRLLRTGLCAAGKLVANRACRKTATAGLPPGIQPSAQATALALLASLPRRQFLPATGLWGLGLVYGGWRHR